MNKILFLLPFEEYITKLDKVCAKSSVWMYILMYQKMACPFWGVHNLYHNIGGVAAKYLVELWIVGVSYLCYTDVLPFFQLMLLFLATLETFLRLA